MGATTLTQEEVPRENYSIENSSIEFTHWTWDLVSVVLYANARPGRPA
jgi:hypothetical protein